jgi:hypothetical protein
MSTQPDETKPAALQTVREGINKTVSWSVVDVDDMVKADHYIFYLRTKQTHRYRNVLDEVRQDRMEAWIRVAGSLVRDTPNQAVKGILEEANEELKVAKRCI